MKTVTYEEFLEFDPSWLGDGAARIKSHFERFGGSMSALDILNLDDVDAEDKLWTVLREEFISAPILHEFGCVCAEYALSLIDSPDPRSVKAIEVKRTWVCGEATDKELEAASDDAWDATKVAAMATRVAWEVARAAWEATSSVAEDAAWEAASAAFKAARAAVARAASDAAEKAAWYAARDITGDAQVAYLIMTLEEQK